MEANLYGYYFFYEKLITRKIDKLFYVLGIKSDSIFSVNDVGYFIINELNKVDKITFDELLSAVIKEFEVKKSDAVKDLKEFLKILEANGVLSHVSK